MRTSPSARARRTAAPGWTATRWRGPVSAWRGHRTTSPVPALVRPAGADECKVSGRECPEGVPSLKDFRGWPDAWQLAWVNGALSNESDLECARDATASEIVDAMRAGQDLDPQKPALYAYLKTTARRARCTFTKPARRVR